MNSRLKLFNGLLRTTAVMLVIVMSLFLYSRYIESPYLYYQNLPFPTASKAYAGEEVVLSVERCNRSKKTQVYTTTHNLVDEKTKQFQVLPNVIVSIEPGCHRSMSRVNIIPPNTAPGRYSLVGIAMVEGMFETHKVDWYSEPFDVIAK